MALKSLNLLSNMFASSRSSLTFLSPLASARFAIKVLGRIDNRTASSRDSGGGGRAQRRGRGAQVARKHGRRAKSSAGTEGKHPAGRGRGLVNEFDL